MFLPLTPTIFQIDSVDFLQYKASLCITSVLIIFEFNLYLLFILAATFRRWYSKTTVQKIYCFDNIMTSECESLCVSINGNDCCRRCHGWYPTEHVYSQKYREVELRSHPVPIYKFCVHLPVTPPSPKLVWFYHLTLS